MHAYGGRGGLWGGALHAGPPLLSPLAHTRVHAFVPPYPAHHHTHTTTHSTQELRSSTPTPQAAPSRRCHTFAAASMSPAPSPSHPPSLTHLPYTQHAAPRTRLAFLSLKAVGLGDKGMPSIASPISQGAFERSESRDKSRRLADVPPRHTHHHHATHTLRTHGGSASTFPSSLSPTRCVPHWHQPSLTYLPHHPTHATYPHRHKAPHPPHPHTRAPTHSNPPTLPPAQTNPQDGHARRRKPHVPRLSELEGADPRGLHLTAAVPRARAPQQLSTPPPAPPPGGLRGRPECDPSAAPKGAAPIHPKPCTHRPEHLTTQSMPPTTYNSPPLTHHPTTHSPTSHTPFPNKHTNVGPFSDGQACRPMGLAALLLRGRARAPRGLRALLERGGRRRKQPGQGHRQHGTLRAAPSRVSVRASSPLLLHFLSHHPPTHPLPFVTEGTTRWWPSSSSTRRLCTA